MRSAAWGIAIALGLLLAAPIAVHVAAHLRAALRKWRARTACPFENDDYETLSPARAAQLVLAESALWWWAVATAVRPPAPCVTGAAGERVPLVVLAPPALPRSSVRTLVHRLRRDGFDVHCPRLVHTGHARAARLRALDQALRAVWDRTGARSVDVIAAADSGALAADHLAAGGSGRPTVRRLFTLGTSGRDGATVPPPTDVIAFYSYDDPFLGPVDAGRRPGAMNVAIRAVGRMGFLHAPYVYGLLREHLLAPPLGRPASWTSAAS
jgi:hypothetical protein